MALHLVVRFNYNTNSIALVIVHIVLRGGVFVRFAELVKGVVVVPI
ncbi:hypothetical protein BAZSYMB_SCAFFOLD00011_0 [Bathymodiolus azoricus thioautotrophic gill symbiont]|uniref:Uncharacterized protein n=1 Tax=Bathymodiolus azoricus thioautotrophic gill symbiont TaxID=235205 RepID=A0A1H6M9I3_9GAMM|nr:hypothetical protein BAZSYMB_SCAFFOLD00011_0 [Bathymodiolus azoricus thioautotrophic gill symbiont]